MYLFSVMFGLKVLFLDFVFEVWIVFVKVFGVMVKGMGELCFEDLLLWLMEILIYE